VAHSINNLDPVTAMYLENLPDGYRTPSRLYVTVVRGKNSEITALHAISTRWHGSRSVL